MSDRNSINKINFEIRSLENFNIKDKEKLERITDNKDYNDSYVRIQTEKINKSISDRLQKIKKLKSDLVDIKNGVYVEEIVQNVQKTISKKKNIPIIDDCIDKKKFYDISKNLDKNTRKISFDREYDRYLEKCDSLPNYIRSALEKMPNNSGYEWKDITFYGKKPRDNSNIKTIFEPLRNKVLRIHEYNGNIYNIYEKVGDNKRTLISKQKITRRVINV